MRRRSSLVEAGTHTVTDRAHYRSQGACDLHKDLKKGRCDDCGQCLICAPPPDCRHEKHLGKRKLAQATQADLEFATPLATRATKFTGSFAETSPLDNVEDEKKKSSWVSVMKEKQCDLFDQLSRSIPNGGFQSHSIHSSESTAERGDELFRRFVKLTASILCPDNPSLLLSRYKEWLAGKSKENKKLTEIRSTLANLILRGDDASSKVAATVLAACSDSKLQCNATLQSELRTMDEATRNSVKLGRQTIGRKRYYASSERLEYLYKGVGFAKRKASHQQSKHIASVVDWIEKNLAMIPGRSRCFTFGSQKFRNQVVYQRGGASYESLYNGYLNTVGTHAVTSRRGDAPPTTSQHSNGAGKELFLQLVKVLTSKGKINAGLSTYYVDFIEAFSNFSLMMKRAGELVAANDSTAEEKKIKKGKVLAIIKKADEIRNFVKFAYGTKDHVQIEQSADQPLHSADFHLNADSTPVFDVEVEDCEECNSTFKFFQAGGPPTLLLKEIKNVLFNREDRDELESMDQSLPLFAAVTTKFMAHKVRAFVQSSAMEEILQLIRNAPPGTIVLVTIDHKQKVLQVEYREAQTAYYGKKGLSVPGTVYTYRAEGTVDLSHLYRDYVVQGYSSQDNVQVAAVIEAVLEDITTRFPSVQQIIFRSDNASCFASQNLIPYIHNLNRKRAASGATAISRWIYFEAGTGKTNLDGHFSYINVKIKAFVQAGNNVTTAAELYSALNYDGGIAGSSSALLNLSKLKSKVNAGIVYKLNGANSKFKAKTGTRATHDIQWMQNGDVHVIMNSNVTPAEVLAKAKLEAWAAADLDVEVIDEKTSTKTPRRRQTRAQTRASRPDSPIQDIPAAPILLTPEDVKGHALKLALDGKLLAALQSASPVVTVEAHTNTRGAMHWLEPGWAQAKNNKQERYSKETAVYLTKRYTDGQGKSNKAYRWSPQETLHDFWKLHPRNWKLKLSLTVPRIKVFFSKPPSKNDHDGEVLVEGEGLEGELVEEVERDNAHQQEEEEEHDLDDVDEVLLLQLHNRIERQFEEFNNFKKVEHDDTGRDKRVKVDFEMTFSKGDRVAGMWKRKWYLGTVVSFVSGGVNVMFDDKYSSKELFTITDTHRIVATKGKLADPTLCEGCPVTAMYHGMVYGYITNSEKAEEWWKGIITCVKKDTVIGRDMFEVTFDDDGAVHVLYAEYILPLVTHGDETG